MSEIVLPRKMRDKLGELHDKFLAGDVEGYVVIYVANDGTTEVNFDLHDSMHMPGLNKIGGGLRAAHDHVVQLAVQLDAKMKHDAAVEAAKAKLN